VWSGIINALLETLRDRGVMIGAGAVILLGVFFGKLAIDITEVIGASS
jgi:hypothetical protein